jgi:DNA-binding transcriptional LysR family regulator
MNAKPDLAWDDFRLVKAVAERGGLTRAAAHLGINHSTAFRRLAQIEAGLGVRLFERLRAGYLTTPAGEAMLAAATRMEADVAGFGRAVAGQAQSPTGEIRVTAAASFVRDLLIPVVARFLVRYPAMRVDMIAAEGALNLSQRDADVAIRASSDPPANLVGRRLSGIAWALYGRAEREPERPETQSWVSLADSVAGGRFAAFVRARAEPDRIALRLNTVDGLREAIEAGIGIGPLPCYVGDACPDLRRLGEPEPDLQADLWLLTHPDLRHGPRVRAFMDFAADSLLPLRSRFEGRG